MVVFPVSKINIGLNIVSKRPDGYHNLETIFYPVNNLHDSLEIIENVSSDVDSFRLSGLTLPDDGKPNLVLRALKIMRQKFDIPPLKIFLLKSIPSGAGLGGGSSDAAFFIKAINEYFNLELDTQQMISTAAQLGSDCAFFINSRVAAASGRGEVFTEISDMLTNYKILLFKPLFGISTPEAYSKVKAAEPLYRLTQSWLKPVEQWKDLIVNDFENFLFPFYPDLQRYKDLIYESGAVYASMTGSGSALFGIYQNENIILPDELNRLRIN